MYNLEYLQTARDDIEEMALYIINELKNPIAAQNLVEEIVTSAEKLTFMPYSHPIHRTLEPLRYEYRKIIVKNRLVFYYVDESNKTVIVARVIYARKKYLDLL